MRPILFNNEMVWAILAGRKTQTRRFGTRYGAAPYAVGDRLYVRETWAAVGDYFDKSMLYIYRADFIDNHNIRWHPSIHMPKDAARIFLEVVNVYPQRLYDISEAEATAEGVSPLKGETARDAFLRLWIDLYGPPKHGSRVWAIEFKVREVRP